MSRQAPDWPCLECLLSQANFPHGLQTKQWSLNKHSCRQLQVPGQISFIITRNIIACKFWIFFVPYIDYFKTAFAVNIICGALDTLLGTVGSCAWVYPLSVGN